MIKMKDNDIILSVVMICRNEESNIEQCIRSVAAEVKKIKHEIIIIDSASTDRTIERASKFPVKIIQLNQSRYLSPSAGRYVGTQNCSGKYIFFIDTDVIIIKGWIKKALKILEDEDIAGVRGRLYQVYPNEKLNLRHPDRIPLGYVYPLAGQASIYKSVVLKKCGSFNPYMKGEEERELYHRITAKGYKLLMTDIPMCYHLGKDRDIAEVNEKAGYFRGVGQIFSHYGFSKITKDLLHDHKKIFLHLIIMKIIMIAILLQLISGYFIILFYTIGAILFIAIMASIIKSPKKLYIWIRARILIAINITKGVMMGIDDARTFNDKIRITRIK